MQLESTQTRGKILVIDDEEAIREGLEMLLLTEGYSVDLAVNGTEGVRKLENQAFDLVLLDLMMPDISGMEVLSTVRQRDRETPIFMITAYGSVEAAVKALKLGATDVIAVNAPPARLETKSGVTVPLAAPVVSMVLAQVSTTEPTSWFTGESRLLCARMKKGYTCSTRPKSLGSGITSLASRS